MPSKACVPLECDSLPLLLIKRGNGRGALDGPFHLLPQKAAAGLIIDFDPESGLLRVGGSAALVATITGSQLGPFLQQLAWAVEGVEKPVQLQICGCVVPPAYEVRPAFALRTKSVLDGSIVWQPCPLSFGKSELPDYRACIKVVGE